MYIQTYTEYSNSTLYSNSTCTHCWCELTGPTGLGSAPGSPGGPTYKLETQ